MANKRMFSIDVTETDTFLEMPLTAQALYFHLAMRGDDDGFVSNPRSIMRVTGCNENDLKTQCKSIIIARLLRHFYDRNYDM